MSLWTFTRDRRGEANANVDRAREARAIRFAGTAYAVTSQAATDALNPFTVGGTLIAVNEGQPLEIVSPVDNIGKVVEVRAGDTTVVGDFLRPAFNADAALVDRYVSVAEAALPSAAGSYWTTHVAIEAGAAGDLVKAVIFPVLHVVEE
jgi:hypothetical protein